MAGHLVLTRKIGETITVGHDVRITVMAVDRGQVRLSIEAPKQVEIHRLEIYKAKFPEVQEEDNHG